MIGCVYWHPSNDRQHFLETLREQLDNLNNKGKEVFILGDINVDFLKYNDDNQTSEYLDMLIDHVFMPLVTKATHLTYTSTFIDHIYTNVLQKGIISKLRHNLSVKKLKKIYYNLIYPYILYAILAWGNTYISS